LSCLFNTYQNSFSSFFDIISIFDIDDIEERASHLKPKVITLYKSFRFFIFEVEYFSSANSISSLFIQSQSSVITICFIQPSFISIFMLEAFASILFSINSFTIDSGLSITSQAAI
jgi:hypothetical protein